MEVKTYHKEFASKKLFVEIGKLARQANGSCRVQYGETTVLVTATMSQKVKDADYFPLSVDYEERYYAAGKIKGSKWVKREGRPTEDAILTGRLIDRALRPRFNHAIRNEVQIVATVLTFDGINDPDIPALFGASLALMISDIPFNGPVAGVRIGKSEGKMVLNPTYQERTISDFDIVIAGPSEKINMIEAGVRIVPEKDVVSAMQHGFEGLQSLLKIQNEIAKDFKTPKKSLVTKVRDEALVKIVRDYVSEKLEKVLYTPHKHEYVEGLRKTQEELTGHITELFTETGESAKKLSEALGFFEEQIDQIVHRNILEHGKRPDGRKVDELRTLGAEVGILPHSHGSGLFNRGSTQALSILTLASPGMEQWIETMELDLTKKRFMHHYVFPPFSTGEVGRLGMPGRREIGHGALAERALLPIIPAKESFPYTIRVVSELLSSNGSTSMASVCGASLALMDGGVPIKTPAAGIAMGLMFSAEGEKYKILTDIQGPEDHHGDMDLKVAGTSEGITALQMDVKIEGVTVKILEEAIAQARKARLQILDVMKSALTEPRAELSKYAPRVTTIQINPDKIRTVIGPQGKMINEIIDKTGVEIDIEQDGSVFITSDKPEGMEEAIRIINELTYETKPDDEFEGKVTRLLDFGAMVEYMPGKEGLVHVSEISSERIGKPSDVLRLGQDVHVRVKNIDDYGRINLTMRK